MAGRKNMNPGSIILGADHAGFALKEKIKELLEGRGLAVTDAGTFGPASADYPDFGAEVATRVAAGEFPAGILICFSGVGMAIVANRFPGVRAALALDEETAQASRRHNDSNILVLAGGKTTPEAAARIVEAWLSTPFEGGRHARRLAKIRDIENRLHGQQEMKNKEN
jgi:ribose 5-phosphate isomerase B